ncbi:MAG: MoaD/ThiS family protein [Lacipirellulaceae bacterium]
MKRTVEFFGIPRARAGIARTDAVGETLGEVLQDLSQRFPGLSETCIEGSRLRDGFTVNIGGERFTRDSATVLEQNQTLLLMSLDAGG